MDVYEWLNSDLYHMNNIKTQIWPIYKLHGVRSS